MNTLFINKLKKNKKALIGKNFHNEHFDAAIEILKIMASGKRNTNHIILDAPTQSGKTSVMEMVYRLLNFESIYEKFGIDNVIYMTADNGSGKGALKYQTKERFEKHMLTYMHPLPIEFLKRSDFDKYPHSVAKTLIMADESQYGWREITSKGQTLLRLNGVDFVSGESLQNNNTFILSVSATTQNERFGDNELKLKPIVKLAPGKGYIGFEDFFDMGVIKPVKEDNFISSYEKFDAFLSEQSKKFKKIYKETGEAKCLIIRLFDNKKNCFSTDSEEFKQIASNNGFSVEIITCKESKIDYSQIEMSIYYNCNHYIENERKFHLIVIKNAFSYGITIKPETKKLIGTCYDVRKDVNTTEATEQGLLGRMSGYECKKEDFKYLEVYINETHYNGIKECRINGGNEFSTPLKQSEKNVRTKCMKKWWDGNENNIVIWNNHDRKPLQFLLDDFVKKHKKDFDWTILFKSERLKSGEGDSFFKKIAKTFMIEKGIFKKMGFGENTFDFRRKISDNDSYAKRMCSSNPLLTNNARMNWRNEKNAEKEEICWGALIDVTKANEKTLKGIVLNIPYGHIGFSKIENQTILKSKKRKIFDGFNTALGKTLKVTNPTYVS